MTVLSIRLRLARRLILIQLGLFSALLLVLPFTVRLQADPAEVASYLTSKSVAANISLSSVGRPVMSRADLVRYAAADPGFWLYARGPGGALAFRASPEVLTVIDQLAGAIRSVDGLLVARSQRHGPFILEKQSNGFVIAVGASRSGVPEILAFIFAVLVDNVLAVVALPLIGVALAVVFIPRDVARSLRMISLAADEATDTPGVRLDPALAPVEALTLVNTFNALLGRLDERYLLTPPLDRASDLR